MKRVTRSQCDSLRLNDLNGYNTDDSGDTRVVRIYRDDKLIANQKNQKNRSVISVGPVSGNTVVVDDCGYC